MAISSAHSHSTTNACLSTWPSDIEPTSGSIRRSQSDPSTLRAQNDFEDNGSGVGAHDNPGPSDHIQIEVSQVSVRVLQSSHIPSAFVPIINRASATPSFAQRHPFLATLISNLATVIAFPILLPVNTVVTPLLMGAAFISKTCGSGELAEDIGTSTIAKALWGDRLADTVATGKQSALSMGFMAFVPILGAKNPTTNAVCDFGQGILKFLNNGAAIENLDIQIDINHSARLDQNIQDWVNALPESARTGIDMEAWTKWTEDPVHTPWTESLSALLGKLYEGAPEGAISYRAYAALVARMKGVLKVIQNDPAPFVPYISTLGVSAMGTCLDRPVMTFMDLELRTQARQILTDIKEGKASLQDMLDIAVKRLVFDETRQKLANAMHSIQRKVDHITEMLKAWEEIDTVQLLDIPALPYRLNPTNMPYGQMMSIIRQVVRDVNALQKNPDVVFEFLARGADSPVPFKEARELSLQSNDIQTKLEELMRQEKALEEPPQGDQSLAQYATTAPYQQYLSDLREIMNKRYRLENADIGFDQAQNRWLVNTNLILDGS
ncbi:hypothetical protein ACVBEF_02710 [Glaciimonas sp. GG7]